MVLPYIDMNPPRVYMCSPFSTLLPPPSPSHPSGSSQCTSPENPALNMDWQFISHMIIYMFQCHSPKPSHPCPLPQSPKNSSIHLCLFCCLAYRIIITIFLNSIYMEYCIDVFLSGLLHSYFDTAWVVHIFWILIHCELLHLQIFSHFEGCLFICLWFPLLCKSF